MESFWNKKLETKKREVLTKDIDVDTLIIGAGLAGILCSYLLKESGVDNVIIEAKEVGSGNTKNTTAKITSQHDLIYSKLIKEFGKEKALHYAQANEKAIKMYKEIIEKKHIDCDFEELSAYLYTLDDIEQLQKELEAATELGIDASIEDINTLPFEVKGALAFKNQAQFNPLKFVYALADELKIYENTKALEVDGNVVITDKGIIKAKNIIVATHFPFINVPGYYFLRMHQERSYCIALKNAADVKGMYIDINKDGYSFRNYQDYLILGAYPIRTGKVNENIYEKLRLTAKKFYPHAIEKYYWSAQDCMTHDGLPLIGEYAKSTPNMYVATGFNKWGMTSSMVAAMILRDKILGLDNDYADIFSPHRHDITLSINNLLEDGFETSKNFLAQKFKIPKEHFENVKRGEGAIVEINNDKVGVYRDYSGRVFTVTTKCPHLGCELKWNCDELSWDCPCHGSRFNFKGEWIEGPATSNIINDEEN